MSSRIRKFPYLATAILAALVARLTLSGLSAWGVAAILITTVWFAIELVHWLLSSEDAPREFDLGISQEEARTPHVKETPPPISLVYFLSEARSADESSIRDCVSHALDIRFRVDDPESDTFVMPFSPPNQGENEAHIRHYMVRIPQGIFAVLVSDRPYIKNPKEFAKKSIRDKRLRSVVERHSAWISVDLMTDPDNEMKTSHAYRIIGKILAAMGGPDCLAIYSPELQRCNEFDPGLLEVLSGFDPLSLFEEPTFEPVIEVSDNNVRMAVAVREAVRRWPEFVAAFRKSHPDERDRYIVKAEFREGKKTEFMWVSVREILEDSFTGILMNDPHELYDVHRGALVNVTLNRLNDWLYPDKDGTHTGGFTLDVLADDSDL